MRSQLNQCFMPSSLRAAQAHSLHVAPAIMNDVVQSNAVPQAAMFVMHKRQKLSARRLVTRARCESGRPKLDLSMEG